MRILPATINDHQAITDVWQASVKATHDFLPDDFTEKWRDQVETVYLPMVQLFCAKDDDGSILGFLGVADQKIEMLFLHPDTRGKGIGKQLTEFAIQELDVNAVDLNEQNEQAVGFYLKMGFKQIGRSEKDGQGNDYPILHLSR